VLSIRANLGEAFAIKEPLKLSLGSDILGGQWQRLILHGLFALAYFAVQW
jgi:hypothetical protein